MAASPLGPAAAFSSPLTLGIFPDPLLALILHSQELWPQICRELKESTAIDSELRWTGMLLFPKENGVEAVEAWAQKHAFPFEGARAGDLRALAPALHYPPEQPTFWFPRIPQLRNPAVLKAMVAALKQEKNISLFENTPIQRLDIAGGSVVGVASADMRFEAPRVALALGAWAGQPPEGAPSTDVYPVCGQMLAYEGRQRFFHPVVVGGHYYMIPRGDGVVLAGSTLEDKGFDKSVTEEARLCHPQLCLGNLPESRRTPAFAPLVRPEARPSKLAAAAAHRPRPERSGPLSPRGPSTATVSAPLPRRPASALPRSPAESRLWTPGPTG